MINISTPSPASGHFKKIGTHQDLLFSPIFENSDCCIHLRNVSHPNFPQPAVSPFHLRTGIRPLGKQSTNIPYKTWYFSFLYSITTDISFFPFFSLGYHQLTAVRVSQYIYMSYNVASYTHKSRFKPEPVTADVHVSLCCCCVLPPFVRRHLYYPASIYVI